MIFNHVADELRAVAAKTRKLIGYATFFSLGVNLLYLATPIYSLQVYDRVLSSGSVATLLYMTLMLLVALGVLSALDSVRGGVLVRMGMVIDKELSARLFAASVDQAIAPGSALQSQHLRDLDNVRQFITGAGINTLLDIPWMPVFLALLFIVHPMLGLAATLSAIALLGLAIANEIATKPTLEEANKVASQNYRFIEASLRNSEAIRALGMLRGITAKWSVARRKMMILQADASDSGGVYMSWIKFLRLFIQSLMLGLGAYYVIRGEMTSGGMFAASFILGRALGPVEKAVGIWRQFISARQAGKRLNDLFQEFKAREAPMSLPQPRGHLTVDKLSFGFPRSDRLILKAVSFAVRPSEVLAVIGPSAAGKTTLVRMLVGVWRAKGGAVRLDGAEIFQWADGDLGRHVGYVPQDIELFPGTVKDNIARFTECDPAAVVEAAKLTGFHESILRLPNGYDSDIGENGAFLSAGQRQRMALTRAVFGHPKLVVMDEPNSNLDSEGEEALQRTIRTLKESGTAVIIVSHRTMVLNAADSILLMNDGAVEAWGPKDEVLPKLMAAAQQRAAPQPPPQQPAQPPAPPSPGQALQVLQNVR